MRHEQKHGKYVFFLRREFFSCSNVILLLYGADNLSPFTASALTVMFLLFRDGS